MRLRVHLLYLNPSSSETQLYRSALKSLRKLRNELWSREGEIRGQMVGLNKHKTFGALNYRRNIDMVFF